MIWGTLDAAYGGKACLENRVLGSKKCQISHYLLQNWKKSMETSLCKSQVHPAHFFTPFTSKIGYIHNIHWCKGLEIKNKEKKGHKKT